MTAQDLTSAIMASNQVAMQWYALSHQTAIPGTPGSVVISPTTTGGYSASFGSGSLALLLLLGVVIVIAVSKA